MSNTFWLGASTGDDSDAVWASGVIILSFNENILLLKSWKFFPLAAKTILRC